MIFWRIDWELFYINLKEFRVWLYLYTNTHLILSVFILGRIRTTAVSALENAETKRHRYVCDHFSRRTTTKLIRIPSSFADSEANTQNVDRSTGVAWSTGNVGLGHSHHSHSHSQSISSIIKQAESQLYVPSLESFTTDGKGEFTCGPIFALFFFLILLLLLFLSSAPAPYSVCVRVLVCPYLYRTIRMRIHKHA